MSSSESESVSSGNHLPASPPSPSPSLSSSSSGSSEASNGLFAHHTNLVIRLMHETFGIDVPNPGAYILRPGTPFSPEQVNQMWNILVNVREQGNAADVDAPDQVQEAAQAPQFNPDLQCPQCNKVFKTKATYRQHSQSVHIGTKCYWPGCSLTFSSERELNKHLKEHNTLASNGDPQNMLTCNFPGCGKVCTMAEIVARHLRRHIIGALNASQS
ncbi:uncharacterized protein F4807DRAFT_466689 [Annulohypoxylon truncatum]|uniref:uncharacterized protein n=1 Tax=Annulohypoxylon truncatum TaxID=327061 RepID=UPI00200895FE|nr:uncharacterized protein F4807DRAFT_466689 [Annulohypoxylon truncatum]KAI1211422.1 hypothetical protein F4807DRAFT_466689 [Annulohypoxylon truncatum]